MAGLLFPTFNAARAPCCLSLRAFPSINSTDKCRSHREMKEETEKIWCTETPAVPRGQSGADLMSALHPISLTKDQCPPLQWKKFAQLSRNRRLRHVSVSKCIIIVGCCKNAHFPCGSTNEFISYFSVPLIHYIHVAISHMLIKTAWLLFHWRWVYQLIRQLRGYKTFNPSQVPCTMLTHDGLICPQKAQEQNFCQLFYQTLGTTEKPTKKVQSTKRNSRNTKV